ncbi:hypothetical protein K474DRAFT_1708004 [Panus rudis PR-1116 ss-1]|nr:hypothetical protein K474DRAFT_1708004 [Panus rudis PR-1116 ss-1]
MSNRDWLNYDIVQHIVHQLPLKDALQLAVISRMFYEAATRYALRDVVIGYGARKVSLFCAFVLADSSRPLLLRTLVLRGGVKDQPAVEALAAVLSAARGLTHLDINDYPAAIRKNQDLLQAISSLTSLRVLVLRDILYSPHTLLSRMASDLKSLTLIFYGMDDYRVKIPPNFPGLEYLALSYCDVSTRTFGGYVWPNVRSLRYDNIDIGDIEAARRAFPNVRELSICRIFGPFVVDWASLDHVIADREVLGLVTFAQPARRLTIPVDEPWERRDIAQNVITISPVVLSTPYDPAIIEALPHCPRLKYLCLIINEDTSAENVFKILDILPQMVGDLSLTAFCLRIRRPYEVAYNDIDDVGSPHVPNLPTAIVESLPRIRYVGFDFANLSEPNPEWWFNARKQITGTAPEDLELNIHKPPKCTFPVITRILEEMDEKTDVDAAISAKAPSITHMFDATPRAFIQ